MGEHRALRAGPRVYSIMVIIEMEEQRRTKGIDPTQRAPGPGVGGVKEQDEGHYVPAKPAGRWVHEG